MKKILLVEDDYFLGDLYKLLLSDAGYSVLLSSDAQDAVDQLDEYGADLILLDLMLPAHNGVEFLHETQSHNDWKKIPVIIITAQSISKIDEKHFNRLGVANILYKSEIKPEDLVEKVDYELKKYHEAI